MIKEALSFLAELGAKQTKAEVIEVDRYKKLIIRADGTETTELDSVPARQHKVSDVESFIAATVSYGISGELSVWVGEESIIAIVDDSEYRENHIVLPLVTSCEYTALKELPKTFSQKQLIQFFKLRFKADVSLLKAIRKVDFKRTSDGQKTVEHGRESLGRSVEAAVQGAEEIPESVTIQVSKYSNRLLRDQFPIELRIDIDVEAEVFWLGPGPDELALLDQRAALQVYEYVGANVDTERVYLGSP